GKNRRWADRDRAPRSQRRLPDGRWSDGRGSERRDCAPGPRDVAGWSMVGVVGALPRVDLAASRRPLKRGERSLAGSLINHSSRGWVGTGIVKSLILLVQLGGLEPQTS